MSRSFIVVCLSGLVFLGSVILAFVMGASLAAPNQHSGLQMVSSDVRFEHRDPITHAGDQDPQGANPQGLFVYQGVLTDTNGVPATGSIDLYFKIQSTIPNPITHWEGRIFVYPDNQGRFQVDLPLTDPVTMITFEDLLIDCRENGAIDPIAVVPVQYAPRAWTSVHARTADEAGTALFATAADSAATATDAENAINAQNAQFAQSADVADALTLDNRVVLSLNAPFSAYGSGYDAPTATRVGNVVYLTGLVDVSTPINTSTIATLPSGMIPQGRSIHGVNTLHTLYNGEGPVRIDVLNNGDIVLIQQLDAGEWFSLNGCSFIVD